MMNKSFHIHTLGCKVNSLESNSIKNDLLFSGWVESEIDNASVLILNSCSVTNNADSKSKYFIRNFRRKNPNSIIVVCGCYSQLKYNEAKNCGANIIIGNKYKNAILDLIDEYLKTKKTIIKIENLIVEKDFESSNTSEYKDNTRPIIKIQDGCNFMCSYCIIPFTRGRQRSEDYRVIIKKIESLVSLGYKEIVLCGVNIAGYSYENCNFYKLLSYINNINGYFRIRISSIEPFQITDDIIELVSLNKDRFCQSWHICLQSGSDKVLKDMNRKYTTNEFYNIIKKIRSYSPLASINTDYIVGYPTESDLDHNASIEFLEKISFDNIHIFPYSARNNTVSSRLKEISSDIKKSRINDITLINKKHKKLNLKKYIGSITKIVIEKIDQDNKKAYGYSNEYAMVEISGIKNNLKRNDFISVKIINSMSNYLVGIII